MRDEILPFCLGIAAGFLLKSACDQARYRTFPDTALTKVRDAGRRQMTTPPRKWDMVDEQGDESFPASDPPGNY
ncbi:hypothetical protein ACHFJ0_08290 [Paracoccus sp. NGMCC 1.201697]|uniref:Lipoprotein n=1 Tax=Paracoccus broussonetiae subsp. drimophilus TaxID=3373869 RepID=A0ABW7LJ54_9RHOB